MLWDKHLLDGKHTLHFVGCGGSGMFPIIQILHAAGYTISGSDVNEGDILNYERELGVEVHLPHDAKLVHGKDMVVYSAAIHDENPELCEARRLGIPCIERSVMLGYVTSLYPSPICVAGTHGKTSTTSMITQVLMMAGMDPAAVIGGKLPYINGYGKSGTGEHIVVESCEYHNTFLQLVPGTAILLNVDDDHLEFFKTMDNLKAAFRTFCAAAGDCVIYNHDDANTREVVSTLPNTLIGFGLEEGCDYRATNITEARPGFFSFDVENTGTVTAHIELGIPGRHQVYNALACFTACHHNGCTPQQICDGLKAFRGASRRFEILGEINGITIADDYAHHPTELAATLTAAKKMNFHAVWAVHQPFTFSRTKMLMDDFAQALQIADHVVLTEIMGSRETNDNYHVYAADLAAKIPGCVWFSTFDEVVDYTLSHAQAGDLVLTLGCGDIYKAAKKMLKRGKL